MIVAGVPFVLLVGLVAHYSVNVPFWDQWELVPLLQKYQHGTLGIGDLFAQHNEHRLFFPRIIMIALAQLTHWDVRAEMLVSLLLAGLGFALIIGLLQRTIARPGLRLLAAGLLTLLVFSPIQQENWLWGWQVQWYLNTFGLLLAVWALTTWQRPVWLRVVVAALGATIATYSLASGMFVWIVCLPMFFIVKELRRWSALWIAAGALCIGAYYAHFSDPNTHPSIGFFVHHPTLFVHYWLIYIGHPLAAQIWLAPFAGLLVIAGVLVGVLYMGRLGREKWLLMLPWFVLAGYAFFADLSTTYSRLEYGVSQAYSNRYVTLAQFATMVLVVLVCVVWERAAGRRSRRQICIARAAMAVAAVLGVSLLSTWMVGAVQTRSASIQRHGVYDCAHHAQTPADPCLTGVYPNTTILWPRLQYIKARHWGGL